MGSSKHYHSFNVNSSWCMCVHISWHSIIYMHVTCLYASIHFSMYIAAVISASVFTANTYRLFGLSSSHWQYSSPPTFGAQALWRCDDLATALDLWHMPSQQLSPLLMYLLVHLRHPSTLHTDYIRIECSTAHKCTYQYISLRVLHKKFNQALTHSPRNPFPYDTKLQLQ